MVKQSDRAYAAGFFDGEGCVHIQMLKKRVGQRRSPSYQLTLVLDQVDPAPLMHIQSIFGGRVRCRMRKNGNRRAQFTLAFYGPQAARFLKQIRPFLIVKAAQADIALEFARKKLKPGQVGRGGLSADTLAGYEAIKQELSRLKYIEFIPPQGVLMPIPRVQDNF